MEFGEVGADAWRSFRCEVGANAWRSFGCEVGADAWRSPGLRGWRRRMEELSLRGWRQRLEELWLRSWRQRIEEPRVAKLAPTHKGAQGCEVGANAMHSLLFLVPPKSPKSASALLFHRFAL